VDDELDKKPEIQDGNQLAGIGAEDGIVDLDQVLSGEPSCDGRVEKGNRECKDEARQNREPGALLREGIGKIDGQVMA
jgi:hypothetical protein